MLVFFGALKTNSLIIAGGGCHQNSNDTKIAPNVNWPKSQSFVHVDEQGNLSPALTEQFLPAQAALLADYWQKTVEKWRFTEVGHSEHYNNFGGFYNTSNHPALKADGSIIAWGRSSHGGTSAPSGSGYTNIYSTSAAFAALKADGSIVVCGSSSDGGSGAPSGNGYIKIYSTAHAFAAVKADGSITAWGNSDSGGTTPASD